MKLKLKKLQKLMDNYYKNSDRFDVRKIDDPDFDDQAFSITAPYTNLMGDAISLTLELNAKTNEYVLSDDGMNIGSISLNKLKKNKFMYNYIKNLVNDSHVTIQHGNEAFQISFKDIKDITTAYHQLIQVIISFNSLANYYHTKINSKTNDNN